MYLHVMHIILFVFSGYASVEILHNGSQLLSASCGHIFHTITNATLTDQGQYTCRARDADDNLIERPFGNVRIVGECCQYHATKNNIIHYYNYYITFQIPVWFKLSQYNTAF